MGEGLPRAERRRRTEERILVAARSLFADVGYERATIRGVAKAAEVDPALVMQYFGSKQELFRQAVRVSLVAGERLGADARPGTGPESGADARPRTRAESGADAGSRGRPELGADELVEHLLGTLTVKMGELPQSSLAMMRSMLTHPEAAASAREVLGKQIDLLAETLPDEDARLRAALMTLVMLGVTVGHQLLELDELRGVPQEELARLLRPSLRALTGQDVS
ncbi:TetR family transcriptional regulator [Nonomuraea sp. NPDC050404]|uniref:TetR/AcrR family transcriptional regulator n=1 Tax=Nonomuraea sp. NPDC050404 TaxID=3155783 RepID=UPI0033D8EB32